MSFHLPRRMMMLAARCSSSGIVPSGATHRISARIVVSNVADRPARRGHQGRNTGCVMEPERTWEGQNIACHSVVSVNGEHLMYYRARHQRAAGICRLNASAIPPGGVHPI